LFRAAACYNFAQRRYRWKEIAMSGMSEVSRIFIAILVAGNALALLAGLALVFAPKRVVALLGMRGAHPVSVRKVTKRLEVPRDAEKIMLRYPRILGGALLAGGVFVVIKWAFFVQSVTVASGGQILKQLFQNVNWSAPAWEMLWVSLLVIVLVGAALAIIVGLLAFTSANKLKKMSALANQWVSTRQAAKAQPYYSLDRMMAARPQTWGVIISVLSLYTLAMLAYFTRA
jgi:hypothetical protein